MLPATRKARAAKETPDESSVAEEQPGGKPPPPGWRVAGAGAEEEEAEDDDELEEGSDEESETELPQEGGDKGTPASSVWRTRCCTLVTAVMAALTAVVVGAAVRPDLMHIDSLSRSLFPLTSDSSLDPSDLWGRFERQFRQELQPRYRDSVPRVGFSVVKTAVEEILTCLADPDEELKEKFSPAVILILGREGDANVSCFTRDLEHLLADALREPPVLRIPGEGTSTRQLTQAFTDTFERTGAHVITIDGVNHLEKNAFMLLHKYTDHETAKYRKAIILLIGYTDAVSSLTAVSSMRDMDALASDFLTNSFIQHLHQDLIEAMIARLAPSVVAVLSHPDSTRAACDG